MKTSSGPLKSSCNKPSNANGYQLKAGRQIQHRGGLVYDPPLYNADDIYACRYKSLNEGLAEAPDWLVLVKVKSMGCHSSREMAIHPRDFGKQRVAASSESFGPGILLRQDPGKGVCDVTGGKRNETLLEV
ncbi:hypothetical protein CEXT_772031 [Caerostris extrusa]|uniref:Uncharacterized protein n=1 Tax=Caerostris extrusa TaxID=172846 RepID=A0AAV4MSX4_CAEEX|nr:hypothetical protein CEXT_772031 [Caerostris extrusa]